MHDESTQRPPLERWFERTFGDDAPTHLGSGWLSGTVSVFLGACGLGAVAVLHFPEWLSSEQFRAAFGLGDADRTLAWLAEVGLELADFTHVMRAFKAGTLVP